VVWEGWRRETSPYPDQFWMIDAQAGFQLFHVVAKGNPFPKQAGIVDPEQRYRWGIRQ
jgi:hypothetical protein